MSNIKEYKVGDKVELLISFKYQSDNVIETIRKLPNGVVTIKEIFTSNSIYNSNYCGTRFYTEELPWHFPIERIGRIIDDCENLDIIDSRFEILDL